MSIITQVIANTRKALVDIKNHVAHPVCTFEEGKDLFRGKYIDSTDCQVYSTGSHCIKDENGKTLAIVLRNVLPRAYVFEIPEGERQSIVEQLAGAARLSDSRGAAAGPYNTEVMPDRIKKAWHELQDNGYIMYFKSSTGSTMKVANRVRSGIFGYYLPKAHAGAVPTPCLFNQSQLRMHQVTQVWSPLLRALSACVKMVVPKEYKKQLAAVKKLQEFTLKGTPYTTGTVNVNFRTAAHVDGNNVSEGIGMMCVLEPDLMTAGKHFSGGQLIFPRYKVAIDAHHGDIVFMNVHEWHGNAPLQDESVRRMTLVLYARKDLIDYFEDEKVGSKRKR
jgi:Oxygenase domain of the 2OGFeDO superfamily